MPNDRNAARNISSFLSIGGIVLLGLLCAAGDLSLPGRRSMVDRSGLRLPTGRLANGPLQRTGTDWIEITTGDCLIVSSLDPTARRHEVELVFSPIPTALDPASSHGQLPLQRRITPVTTVIHEQSELNRTLPPLLKGSASKIVPVQTWRRFRLPRQGGTDLSKTSTSEICHLPLVAQTQRVAVYSDHPKLDRPILANITQTLEDFILPQIEERVGPIEDIDLDTRIGLVISALQQDAEDIVPLLGCVRPDDFLADSDFGGDLIYLDPALLSHPALMPVLTHELAHAAVFSRLRLLRKTHSGVNHVPEWFNEAVAHTCEQDLYPYSENLKQRLQLWKDNPGQWPLAPHQRLRSNISSRGPVRAAGLMFVHFLRQSRSLPEMIDEAAVGRADYLNTAHDDFRKRFTDWTVWMWQQQSTEISEPLVDVRSPNSAEAIQRDFVIAGTAARWLKCSRRGFVRLNGPAAARLCVTLVGQNVPSAN